MVQGCAEDFSKVNKQIKDASNYILTQCTYILRLSPLREQLLALPYLFSLDKLLTSLLCFTTTTSGGLGALQAGFHLPIPGSHAEAGAESHEKESTEGFQGPGPTEGSHGGET